MNWIKVCEDKVHRPDFVPNFARMAHCNQIDKTVCTAADTVKRGMDQTFLQTENNNKKLYEKNEGYK
jgi:hypothetical protein